MSRPLIQHSIIHLETLFAASNSDPKFLKQLESELQHRHVPKAIALLAKVRIALQRAAETTVSPPAVSPPAATPPRRLAAALGVQLPISEKKPQAALPKGLLPKPEVPPVNRPNSTLTTLPQQVAESFQAQLPFTEKKLQSALPMDLPKPAVAVVKRPDSTPTMSVADAYKVLKANPGTPWELIEQTRRELVQLAHPARLALINVEKRDHILAEAKLVNSAYSILAR